MAFVQFSKVSLAYGNRDILKDVSVNLQTGSKAALTGANGSGKSTLIKIMAGLIEPDTGTRATQKDTRIAYLPQSGLTHHGCTLREEADKAFDYGYKIQEEIEKIGDELKEVGNDNTKNTDALVTRHSELMTQLEESGWHRRNALAESVLFGLGFSHSDLNRMTEEFSGGWQMRIALAKTLMQTPDILLLDEPTNYLDIEARTWLEQFLKNFKGGFLLVSHDRYFLDVTINTVYELFNGELKCYQGNFTKYEKVRAIELETLISAYEKQQQEIAHLQSFVDRFRYKATKAAQAQERQKQLDKIVPIEIPESLKKIKFSFPSAPHAGNIILRTESLTKSYDGTHNIINNLNLVLENGERLVVVGHNGAGKSTLLRMIAGIDHDFSGKINLGAGVSVGYFSQDNAETICGKESVLDFVEKESPLELIPKARDYLGAFLFRGNDVFKSLDILSGGEKSRLALLRLLLHPVNFLILDEPTNHLDIHSKDVLLSALKDFGGTVIFVSHDRGFIEGLATRVLELKPGVSRIFPGDYVYYMERLEAEANGIVSFTQVDEVSNKKNVNEKVQALPSNGALSWEDAKKQKAQKEKKARELEKIEKQIAELELKKKSLEENLSLPSTYSNGAKAKEVQTEILEVTHALEDLNEKWYALAE